MKLSKRFLSAVTALALSGSIEAGLPVLAMDSGDSSMSSIIEEFANPSVEYRAGFRYELPGGEVDQEQVKAEIRAIKEAGFAVVEITAHGRIDGSSYGISSESWKTTLKTIYSTCNEFGMQADIHLSFINGVNLYVPGLEVLDEAVSKELIEEHVIVDGGTAYTADMIVPVPEEANISRKVVRAYLAEITKTINSEQIEPAVGDGKFDINNIPMTDVNILNPDTFVDITDNIVYQAADNTAIINKPFTCGEAGRKYALIVIYEQGKADTLIEISTEPARKIDYFSAAGTKAFTDYYDNEVLDDELRFMMYENGGNLFSDSYGADANWTNGFLEIFEEVMGYDIGQYLPILFTNDFDFDGDFGTKIRNDHKDVLTDLYCKHHLEGLTEWANSLGMKYRDQVVYSAYRDMMTAAMYVDIPETESLYFNDEIDNYIAMSSPANITRKSIVSTELGALRGRGNEANIVGGYSQTWDDIIIQANRSFAGGVNQMMLHTFPYRDNVNYAWPGYTAFGHLFSENWGARLPSWQDAEDVADYLARAQYIMRKGVSQRDVVIYKHNYDWVRGSGDYILDQTLTREGYTFDFINPDMMQQENAVAVEGAIDVNGGNYRAFIIDSEQYPFMYSFARPEADMMPVEAALKIEEYANAGVPIIIVGEAPTRTESLSESDDEIVAAFARMTEAEQIIYVDSEADIAGALRELEIRPNADNNTECGVTTYLRTENDVNYYFLYNQGDFDSIEERPYFSGEEICDQVISFKGEGQPYCFDLWSGEVTPIADYTVDNGYVNINVQLDIHEAAIIAIGSLEESPSLHAVDTAAAVSYDSNGNLVFRADEAGEYTISLSDGSTKDITVEAVASAVIPENWSLTVESWTPANEFGTTGVEGTLTSKNNIGPIELTELKPWSEIPEIGETVSGIGTYMTTFMVDGPADGAILSLGDAFDTVSVKVNGEEVTGINQSTKEIDLGELVKEGENTLEIQSVSTLRNVLRVYDEAYAEKEVQSYGLLGPVRITPYVNCY